MIETMTPETPDLFVPPAAEGLPIAALDSATEGAERLDASARTPYGRNLLAHALVQLARDGWLRAEAADGFEPVRDRETPEPEDPDELRRTPAEEQPAAAEADAYANGICTYGEDQAPGSGCIKPAGHDGAHLVTPGDTRDIDDD